MAITKVTNRVLGDSSVGVAQLSAGAVTLDKLITSIQQALLPVGAVQALARTTAPAGWLICNGDAIGTSGTVQGVAASALTNIRSMLVADSNPFGVSGSDPLLPDLRGIFVRGSGSQTISGDTYSGTFAAKQRDALQQHSHNLYAAQNGGSTFSMNSTGGAFNIFKYFATEGANGRTDTETRPANIALLYCIKY